MKVLELFCGTKSFSNVCEERGHETFTIDIDKRFKPSLVKDIMNLEINDIPFQPDVIWSSPPCQCFSIMVVSKNWKKEGEKYTPKRPETIYAMELHKRALMFMNEMNPKIWFIENPRAMLRKMYFMQNLPRKTVTYCKYGMNYQKATDIWTNCDAWSPRPICKANDPCHVRASRGSRNGIQGLDGFRENRNQNTKEDFKGTQGQAIRRGIVPRELCIEICEACEKELKVSLNECSLSQRENSREMLK